eukprot:4403705-Pyramimonas_sp.AAC.1
MQAPGGEEVGGKKRKPKAKAKAKAADTKRAKSAEEAPADDVLEGLFIEARAICERHGDYRAGCDKRPKTKGGWEA